MNDSLQVTETDGRAEADEPPASVTSMMMMMIDNSSVDNGLVLRRYFPLWPFQAEVKCIVG